MYVKVTKSAGHAYIQLAESFRDDSGRPRQRVVSTLGRADETGGQVAGVRQFGALILKKVHVFNSLSVS